MSAQSTPAPAPAQPHGRELTSRSSVVSAKRTAPAEEAPPSTAVTEREVAAVLDVIVRGDLSKLSPDETVNYYRAVCQSLGLNPLTQPFAYLTLSGRKVLYATKACTDQ